MEKNILKKNVRKKKEKPSTANACTCGHEHAWLFMCACMNTHGEVYTWEDTCVWTSVHSRTKATRTEHPLGVTGFTADWWPERWRRVQTEVHVQNYLQLQTISRRSTTTPVPWPLSPPPSFLILLFSSLKKQGVFLLPQVSWCFPNITTISSLRRILLSVIQMTNAFKSLYIVRREVQSQEIPLLD